MTTISITGKQPGKTAVTISSTVNPAVKTVVPVTVLSRNLLSYGPASGYGLTATINGDGSLHIKGTPTRQWTGLSWKFPCPVHGIVTFGGTTISGLGGVIKCLDGDGRQLGSQITVGSNGVAIPDGTVSLQLNILATETTPTMKDGDIRIQLESGDTVHEWMKPDDTSLEGGGYELANLVPSFTSILPKTVEGVTFTSTDGHTPSTRRARRPRGRTSAYPCDWTRAPTCSRATTATAGITDVSSSAAITTRSWAARPSSSKPTPIRSACSSPKGRPWTST